METTDPVVAQDAAPEAPTITPVEQAAMGSSLEDYRAAKKAEAASPN